MTAMLMDGLDFYAVKVDPGKERMAQDILTIRKILAKLPYQTIREIEQVNRRSPPKVIERQQLLLRGLVFVAFPIGFDIPWFALKQRLHIIRGVIGMDHRPTKLDKEGLMRLFDDIVFTNVEVAAHKRTYHLHDRVKVTHGPFAGFAAEVIDPTENELRILCDIFGRSVPVRIEADQLDMIEPLETVAA